MLKPILTQNPRDGRFTASDGGWTINRVLGFSGTPRTPERDTNVAHDRRLDKAEVSGVRSWSSTDASVQSHACAGRPRRSILEGRAWLGFRFLRDHAGPGTTGVVRHRRELALDHTKGVLDTGLDLGCGDDGLPGCGSAEPTQVHAIGLPEALSQTEGSLVGVEVAVRASGKPPCVLGGVPPRLGERARGLVDARVLVRPVVLHHNVLARPLRAASERLGDRIAHCIPVATTRRSPQALRMRECTGTGRRTRERTGEDCPS